MGASGEEKDEEKGGKSEERKAGFFFFVNEGATNLAMAAKVLLHPLTHWMIDSRSSWHMTPRADLLDEIQPAPISTVTSATGAKAKFMGMGCAKFMGADGELVGLKNVLWVPDFYRQVGRCGCPQAHVADPSPPLAEFGQGGSSGIYGGECHRGEQQGVQREELIGGSAAVKASATSGQEDWETWHRWLAHVAVSTLEVMHKEKCVHGLQLQGDGAHYGNCEACMQNKFARFPFPHAQGSAKAPLEVVHMDLVGPMRTEGTGGVLYFLTMVDEWSRFMWARPLSKTSDAAATIKEDWLPMVEWQSMRLVKVLRSDRGGEFLGAEFTKFLKRNGIRHQLTCPGIPQQNGIAECANRTIGKAAKTLLGAAGMPYKFWPEAVRHIITVKNRVLTHEMERSALEEVHLHLEDFHGSELTSEHSGGGEQQVSGHRACCNCQGHQEGVQRGASPHGQQTATREKRLAAPPSRLKYSHLGGHKQGAMAVQADEEDDEEMAFCFFTPLLGEPATLEEALSGPQKEEWKAAMDAEFNSLIENGTWELVELPEGRRPISSKWVFKMKSGADGALERFNSRLVAKGFQQKEKVDFGEIFVPVVKPVTLRTVLAGAAEKGWPMKQMDITTALLNGVLLEDIYMAQPDGYEDGTSWIERTQKLLMDNYKCKMLGDVHYYLGLEMDRDVERRWLKMHQSHYISGIMECYGVTGGRTVMTPFPAGFKLKKAAEEDDVIEVEQ
ncbi:unnamed protein product [Closterium sp. NIES-53]